ncbi:MAG: peptide chain release factor N(5)-glutamine methyltransferase [Clostridia bacterium]|nr:peptide chain release factor N(5)-glutamine methyltransferase [Clostridia bacterium]
MQQALRTAARRFATAGLDQPRLEAEVLLAWASGYSRPQLLARLEEELAAATVLRFWQAVERRAGGYPLQYLTGKQEFMSLEFTVNPAVLIPRQDTEIVVTAVLQRLQDSGNYSIADCGTGSGAIVLSLAHYLPCSFFYATDISAAALAVARQNASRLGLAERVVFIQGDYLAPLKGLKFDVITANPPYIAAEDLDRLPVEVQFEPRQALNGGPDGLNAYRRILPQAAPLLKKGGFLALEIGYNQGEAVRELAAATGAYRDLAVLSDYGGRDRCLLAYR